MESANVDAVLVSSVHNVTYLSGFSGDDSLALVAEDTQDIITDFRYVEQVGQECRGWGVVSLKKDLWKAVGVIVKKRRIKRLGFETAHLSHRNHARLAAAVGGVKLVALENEVEKLRELKDAEEVKAIEAAIRTQEAAFAEVREWVRPGLTEKEVACELDYRMRCQGAEASAFETIAAAGPRGSLPHARPTERVIGKRDALLVDWGARRFFYNSDLTRVVHFGTVGGRFEEVYDIVRQAQERGLAAVRPGVTFSEVDAAAREFIRDKGYGEQFGHSLGHGVGLEVHERPTVKKDNKETLRPGMVFTVEPGIYIPGWGGVRIEDMVLVTDRGVRVLSTCDKDLGRMTL